MVTFSQNLKLTSFERPSLFSSTVLLTIDELGLIPPLIFRSMEGSESEAVFESLNLNPRIILNEILNIVENLLDESFDYFHQEASSLLNADGTDRSQHLSQGVGHLRSVIESNLGKRLGAWQEYCLHHCFAVPQGFSLQKSESPSESLTCQDMLSEPDLDTQLDSLRGRLTLAGKDSAELNRELQALERQSTSNDSCAAIVNEALQLYEQNGAQKAFQEMVNAASQLRTKMESLRTKRIEDAESIRTKKICDPNRDMSLSTLNHGLSDAKLEDLQEFLADLKKM
ncbi:protein MIS12 homolog [Euphorbia lathyris]|uniref:protein MIS12 homolog n=1 Tax=Euphorbia lathyris TaxID=212925 RepID=UPI0033134E96